MRGLPGLTLDPDVEAFRADVRAFLADALAPGRAAARYDRTDLTGWDEGFERTVVRAAGDAGLLGVSLPVELGGGGRPPSWQAAVSYEAAYHDAPLIDTAAVLVAPTVAAFGTAAQRDTVVRAACAGTINAAIAYTEAGAGSDLSNVATTGTAQDDGDFVLDGEKVFVTGAHKADWCCTIARTDESSRGKRGLSMFLVDMNTPGVAIERHATANRWTLSTVRFDGARVSATTRCSARSATAGGNSAAHCSPSAAASPGWAGRPARSKRCSSTARAVAIRCCATSSRGW